MHALFSLLYLFVSPSLLAFLAFTGGFCDKSCPSIGLAYSWLPLPTRRLIWYPAFVPNIELRINRKFEIKEFIPCKNSWVRTRPDTRPIPVVEGGQGPKCAFSHFPTRSLQTDGPMDQRTNGLTDGPTKWGVESRSTRLKRLKKV